MAIIRSLLSKLFAIIKNRFQVELLNTTLLINSNEIIRLILKFFSDVYLEVIR